MNSCIYKGSISHKRRGKVANDFSYSLFMLYLDLAELPTLFDRYWFWSTNKRALARFKREDHFGDKQQPLDQSIRDLIAERTGQSVDGPIRLLTHLSYFGHCFNPLSVYYCFDRAEQLQYTVLEVSNTPWGEQHCYVLSADNKTSERFHHYRFAKDFHVSPFLPMDMQYVCRLNNPAEQMFLSLDNHREGKRVFASQLALERRDINSKSMATALLCNPLMTLKVSALILWQAALLLIKKARFYDHPGSTKNPGTTAATQETTQQKYGTSVQ
jgi:DUF1365 family protein